MANGVKDISILLKCEGDTHSQHCVISGKIFIHDTRCVLRFSLLPERRPRDVDDLSVEKLTHYFLKGQGSLSMIANTLSVA